MGVFIFNSGGGGNSGPALDWDQVNIEPQFVLQGKKFLDKDKQLKAGTILNWDGTVLSGASSDGNKVIVVPDKDHAWHIAGGRYLSRDIEISKMAAGSAAMSINGKTVTLSKQAGYIADGSETLNVPSGSASMSRNGNLVTLTKQAGYIEAGTSDLTVPLTTKSGTISSNGSYTYTPSSSYVGFSQVSLTVSVPTQSYSIQSSRSYGTVSSNGSYTIYPGSGYDAMSKATFTVNVSSSSPSTGTGSVGTSGSSLTISAPSGTLYMAAFVLSSIPSGNNYVAAGMVRKGSSTGRDAVITSSGTLAVGNNLSASFSGSTVTISVSGGYAFYGSSYTAYVCYA